MGNRCFLGFRILIKYIKICYNEIISVLPFHINGFFKIIINKVYSPTDKIIVLIYLEYFKVLKRTYIPSIVTNF